MADTVTLHLDEITKNLASLTAEEKLPGMGVCIADSSGVVLAEGFGFADIETRTIQSPQTRQRIGSITKTMLGITAMRLVERGKLRLDSHVPTLLPEITFLGPTDNLTVWHLLTHTSGIGEAPTLDWFLDPISSLFSDNPQNLPFARQYPDGIEIEQIPGTHWHYQNHGFALLGEIVARAEETSVADALKHHIFDPLDMTDSDALDKPHERLSTPYHRTPTHDELDILETQGKERSHESTVDGTNIRGPYKYVTPLGAGEVQASLEDMGKYGRALLNQGGGLLDRVTFQTMTDNHYGSDQRLLSLGLTFFRRSRVGRPVFEHGGSIAGGWNTLLSVFPQQNIAIAIHLNQSSTSSQNVFNRVIATIFGQSVTWSSETFPPNFRSSLEGVYVLPSGKNTNFRPMQSHGRIQIRQEGNDLVLRSRRGPWRSGFKLCMADQQNPPLLTIDTGEMQPPLVVPIIDSEGAVTGLRLDQLVVMQKDPTLTPWEA